MFGAGEIMQLTKIPGLPNISDMMKPIMEAGGGKGLTPLGESAATLVEGRTVPTGLSHIAAAADTVQRDTSQPFGKVISQSPFARETLPPKIDQLTGDAVKSDPWLQTILLGSRMKDAKTDRINAEVNRLMVAGYAPTIADIQDSYDDVKAMKEQLSQDDLTSVLQKYGATYQSKVESQLSGFSYGALSDEKKKDKLDSIRKESIDAAVRYAKTLGYKKP
jgi:hypothetical protein